MPQFLKLYFLFLQSGTSTDSCLESSQKWPHCFAVYFPWHQLSRFFFFFEASSVHIEFISLDGASFLSIWSNLLHEFLVFNSFSSWAALTCLPWLGSLVVWTNGIISNQSALLRKNTEQNLGIWILVKISYPNMWACQDCLNLSGNYRSRMWNRFICVF